MPEIPGPGGGEAAVLAEIGDAGGLHNFQLRLHERYGDVARFEMGGLELVSVADPVLLEATARLDERPDALFAFLEPLCEAGNLQTLPEAEHTPWRRLLLSTLAGRRTHEAYAGRFAELAGELADAWAARGAGGPVELQQELSELSLRMICEYALGGIGAEESAAVVGAFETVLTEYLGGMYRADESPAEEARRLARAGQALDYLRATVDRVLAGHHFAQAAHAGGRSDLIATLADGGISDARVRDSVLMIMLAAHHTTGVSVSWTLHLLGRHPDVAERVVREVDAVLGERTAPAYEDLRRMPYLEMVVKEAMRLYTPGPYGARETAEEITVGDYTVPAGATVFYPFWAIHLNPAYWPEPHRFDPERFTAERSVGRPRLAYVPFGLGPRGCEGAQLAMVEAKLVLAVLLRRLSFAPVAGREPTPVERFVLWAEDGITMAVTPRGA